MILDLNGFRLELFHFDKFINSKPNYEEFSEIGLKHFAIEVENMNTSHQKIKENGYDIDEPTKGTTCKWFCFIRDPDGINIELIQY